MEKNIIKGDFKKSKEVMGKFPNGGCVCVKTHTPYAHSNWEFSKRSGGGYSFQLLLGEASKVKLN